MIKQDTINGAMVLVDVDKPWRLYDAFGPGVSKFILGAASPVDANGNLSSFVVTAVGTSVLRNSDVDGYLAEIVTGATAYDGINAQLRGEPVKIADARRLYAALKLKAGESTADDILFGILETKTAILNTSSSHALAATGIEGVFFLKLTGSTEIKIFVYKDNTLTFQGAVEALDTEDHLAEISVEGGVVKLYFDDELVTQVANGLPDGELTPSLNVRAGASGAVTLNIAELRLIQVA